MNPNSASEQDALAPLRQETGAPRFALTPGLTTYNVKVGDVCFVIIGQIVGRFYLAIRYQPSACIVINSPTHDPLIARQVRAIWRSDDPVEKVRQSLLLDYSTKGVFNGHSLDGWDEGSHFQIGAAMRLLFYYPKDAAPEIAARLDRMSVDAIEPALSTTPGRAELDAWMMREVGNGVRTAEFIKAVSWSVHPRVQTAVLSAFTRSWDPEVLLACLPGIPPNHDDLVLERLSMFIDRLPRVVSGPYGDGYNVLVALAQRYGDRARPAFNRYVEDGAVQRGLTMCYVLREIRSEWSEELLSAFLADTRDVDGWTYAVDPDQDGPRRPIRICDEAAATIAASHPDLTFEMWGNHANLDLQIRSMQKALGHKQGG